MIMIRDVHNANKTAETSAMEIMRLNNAMETIYGFYYQQDKNMKETNLSKYEELLERRKSVDDEIDVVVDFYSAVCESLRNLKYSKLDKKLHKQRIKKMKEMCASDDFDFMDNDLGGDFEDEVESPVIETKVVETKKK